MVFYLSTIISLHVLNSVPSFTSRMKPHPLIHLVRALEALTVLNCPEMVIKDLPLLYEMSLLLSECGTKRSTSLQ